MVRNITKEQIIADFKLNPNDTGSVEVQIALLTHRINQLTLHFKTHAKDNNSKTGLMKLVGRRRRFLDYVARRDASKYKEIITRLGLRK